MADKTSNIYINGKQAGDTLSDLRKKARELSNEINQLAPGTEAYTQKMEELGKVQGTLNQHNQTIKNAGMAMSTATKSASERLAELNDRVNSGTLSSRQLSKAIKEYETIALQAGRTSPVGQQAIQDGAQLVDKLGDMRAEMKNAAHDGRNMQAAMQLGQTVLGGYAAAQAGMALMGVESEKYKETLVKLTAATTLLNSVEQIRKNLEKESFLMQKARNLQTVAATAITYMYTAAVGSSTGALKLFRLALIATGIGAVIVGVGLLVANFEALSEKVMDGVNAFDRLGKGMKIALSIMLPFVAVIWGAIEALKYFGIIEQQQTGASSYLASKRMEAIKKEREERRKANDEAIKKNKSMMVSAGDMYDWEIEKAKAAGKSTELIEKEKRAFMRQTHREAILLHIESMKLNVTNLEKVAESMKAIEESRKALKAISRQEELDAITKGKEAADAAKKAAENAKSEAQKLNDELLRLKEAELKYRQDLETNARLARLKDEEKELEESRLKIEAKYASDLEAARKLAEQKGEVGKQAQERLDALEIIMREDLEAEKAKIEQKWRDAKEAQQKKDIQASKDRELRITQAMLETELAEAKLIYENIADYEVEQKELARQKVEEIIARQLDHELTTKIQALKNQLENEEITLLEFQVYKEQLEAEHQLNIEKINRDTQERIAQYYVDNMVNSMQITQQLLSDYGKLRDALHQREMHDIAKERDAKIKALDQQLNKGVISERDHAEKIQAIKEDAAEKERAEKTRQAKSQKAAALIEAAINTALAIIKATPNVPLMALAGVTGAIQTAVVAATPIPQFFEGGLNVTGAQDGRSYQAKYIGKHPGGMLPDHPVVLASERGPEYFVPNPLLHNPVVLDAVRTIENIRLRQFANGGATQALNTPMANANGNQDEQMYAAILQSIQENAALSRELLRILPNLGIYLSDERLEHMMERAQELERIRA